MRRAAVTGRARAAERELMARKIWCFSTPSCATAENHPKDHFRWMLNGAELYANLETTHVLFDKSFDPTSRPMCFETFPQAIACALAGRIVSARQKRQNRRELLNCAKIDTSKLTNIDQIDAALCSYMAHLFAQNSFNCYGDAETGFIVVPTGSIISAPFAGNRKGQIHLGRCD